MNVWEIALSVALSLATSFAFFYWQFHLVVPRVRFSTKISKLPAEGGGFRYRVKYENCGQRAMIEVTLLARLRIKGIRSDFPSNWGVANIPMESVIPRVEPIRRNRLRQTPELELWKAEFDRTFPAAIVDEVRKGAVPLEHLLRLGSQTELRVYLFAYDEFSGSRKVFASDVYGADDVIEGPFDVMSLDIVA